MNRYKYVKILWEIRHFLFPPRCMGCKGVLTKTRWEFGFCTECESDINIISNDYCMKCGKLLLDSAKELCLDCERKMHYFNQNRSLYSYTREMKRAMYDFKYSNCKTYAYYFSKQAKRSLAWWINDCKIDVVIPVPMYKKKERKRGYNQAAVLARAISDEFLLPFDDKLIVRNRDTIPMKGLSGAKRKENLKNAFNVDKIRVKSNILVVDDIYTTGETMDAIARELLRFGAVNVYGVTVCSGIDKIGGE